MNQRQISEHMKSSFHHAAEVTLQKVESFSALYEQFIEEFDIRHREGLLQYAPVCFQFCNPLITTFRSWRRVLSGLIK